MIFDNHKTLLGKPTRKPRTPRVTIEGKWSHISKWVKELRRDEWRETQAASGEPSGFKFTEVTFER